MLRNLSVPIIKVDIPAPLSSLAALSFNGNKTITTGGGGAILSSDPNLYQTAKHLTTTARVECEFEIEHDQIGFNYRLPNINAAIGCAQLEQLPNILSAKRKLALMYIDAFTNIQGVSVLQEPVYAKSNYWLNVLLLDADDIPMRNEVLKALQSAGYLCRPMWKLMHWLPMYTDCPRMNLDAAEQLYRRTVTLPSSATLMM